MTRHQACWMGALANHIKQWPPGEDSLIFTDDDGKPIWRYNFYKHTWWPALKRAGIGSLRFHDLRHTSAALAIAADAHPKTIQVRLGRHSAASTLDVYGGLFDSLDEDLATASMPRRPPRNRYRPSTTRMSETLGFLSFDVAEGMTSHLRSSDESCRAFSSVARNLIDRVRGSDDRGRNVLQEAGSVAPFS